MQSTWPASLGPVPTESPPADPPVDPLQSARTAHAESVAKRDLRREHKALLEEVHRLEAEVAALSKMQASPTVIVYDKPKAERCDAILCATLSDWHVDEVVDREMMHGLNEYSPEIARERARLCFQNLLALADIHARDSRVTTIDLDLLGDFFSGWIHEELLAGTAMAPADAAQHAKALLVSGIQFLLDNGSYGVEATCVPGNHGRLTDQVHFNDPTGTSLESAMYHHIHDWFRNEPRVSINVANTAIVYKRLFPKFRKRLMHGYEVRYGGGVGGLAVPLRKWLYRANESMPADLTVFGHFHRLDFGGNYLGNDCLIGWNRYAESNGFGFSKPRQAAYLIHARHGGEWSGLNPIWVDPTVIPAAEAA